MIPHTQEMVELGSAIHNSYVALAFVVRVCVGVEKELNAFFLSVQ
jgi:hypothetical protein